jgi:hypothetical protein
MEARIMDKTTGLILSTFILTNILAALFVWNMHGSYENEPRLVGCCNGQKMLAVEEDEFPVTGCTWIEEI